MTKYGKKAQSTVEGAMHNMMPVEPTEDLATDYFGRVVLP